MSTDNSLSKVGTSGVRYRFGFFEVDTADGRVVRQGKQLRLQEQPFQVLVALLEGNGQVVTREELCHRLWPDDTFVDFDKSLGVAITKLRDALDDEASNPRFIETLPRRGYRFIAPVERLTYPPTTPSGREVLAAAEGSGGAVVETPAAGIANRRWYAAIPLLMVLCLMPVYRHFWPRSSRETSNSEAMKILLPVAAAHVRKSVAILGFRNLPGRAEDAWMSSAFSEMLDTELAAGGALRLVSGEDVARAKRELPISEEATLAKATLQRLHGNPGADLVVLGAYTTVMKDGKRRIRLDLRLQDTVTGETLDEESLTGGEDALFEMASDAGARLRQAMGLPSISAEESSTARATLPGDPQAVRLYAQGRAKLWNFDYLGARDLLVKAVTADPKYPLGHAALSEAWWHLGYERKSRAEAQRALEFSSNLPEDERLLVEIQYRRSVEDWPKAVEACQALFRLFPDRLDYGLQLASAQIRVNTADALRTLAALHQLPAPTGDDPRIDMLEATALINSDLGKAREAGKRAIAKATAQGSHVLVAFTQGTLCEEGVGAAIAEAVAECETARQTSEAVGDHNGAAMALNNLAAVYYQTGNLERSEQAFLQAMQQFQEIGNLDGVATAMSNLGGVRLALGDLTKAKKYFKDAIPNYQVVEDPEGVALALNNLGDLSRQNGELDAAKLNYEQAMSTAKQNDNKSAQAYVLSGLGDVLRDRGELVAARKSYEESLALRKQLGEKQTIAETQVSLAEVSIEEHAAADAEVMLRGCKKQFHEEHQADDELSASVALTSALLAQGKNAEAEAELQRMRALAASSQNRLGRLQYELASGRTELVSGHPQNAAGTFSKVLREARASGFAGLEMEARLAVAELEKKAGRLAAAAQQSAAVEKEARSRGFGLIARRAAGQV